MADKAGVDDVEAAAQRAAEQARLRKERREAKIKAGGSARLSKITGMGGRAAVDGAEQQAAARPADAPAHADPDEVDISEHYYAPRAAVAAAAEPPVSDAQLRQLMLGLDRPGQSASPSPSPGPGAGDLPAGLEDDPLLKMMSQMMGGAGALPGMPPLQQPPSQQQQQQQAARPDAHAAFFRALHALLALGLGLYVTLLTPFSGTRAEREHAALAHARHAVSASAAADDDANEHHKLVFLCVFATGEALLLTARALTDKGRPPPSGLLWTVAGFVPEPLRGYLTVALRYSQIFTTVRADMLACMFVLGVCAWWKS